MSTTTGPAAAHRPDLLPPECQFRFVRSAHVPRRTGFAAN